jgi:hypothetical protein
MALAFACSPSTTPPVTTCVNAIAGPPDGSINPVPNWPSSSCNTQTLAAAVNQLIADAGACKQDSDCVFLTDGGAFVYDGFTSAFVNPVALANVELFEQNVEGMIQGFQDKCTPDGGGELINVGEQGSTPQGELCLSCFQGLCVANPPLPDAGS